MYGDKWVTESNTPADQSYNCHGYSMAKGEFWIQSNDVDALLKADGYNVESFDPITGVTKKGDILLYENLKPDKTWPNPQHTVIMNDDGTANSKNGDKELVRNIDPKSLQGLDEGSEYGKIRRTASGGGADGKIDASVLIPASGSNGSREIITNKDRKALISTIKKIKKN